jgi:hypothetical protein
MPEIKVPEFVDNRWQVLGVNGFNPPVTTFFCRDLKAKDPTRDKAIIKYFPPESEFSTEIKDLLVEINYLREEGIKGTISILQSKMYWMAFEYVAAQSLFKEVTFNKPMGEDGAFDICRKIAIILDKAEENEILHLALNPKNIFLLNDGTIKIKDWLVEEKNLSLFAGLTDPCFFQAPEVLAEKPHGHLSDIYSLGVIAAFLVTGDWEIKFKLEEADLPDTLKKILPYFIAEDPSQRIQSWPEAIVAFDGGRFVPVKKVEGREAVKKEMPASEDAAQITPLSQAIPVKKTKVKIAKRPREPITPRVGSALLGALSVAYSKIQRGYDWVNWRTAGIFAAVALAAALVVISFYALPILFSNEGDNQARGETKAISLPSFAGMAIEDAEQELAGMGCTCEKEESFSDEVEARLVISQDPAAGDYESGFLAVKLVVSKGHEPAAEEAAPEEANNSNQTASDAQLVAATPTTTAEPAPATQPAGKRPVASFSLSPASGPSSGVFVSFNASGSYDPDGGSIVSYSWSFGASGVTAGHEFTSAVAPTTISITLTVTDDEGQSSSVTKPLNLY